MIVLPDEVSAGVVGTEEHKEEIRNLIAEKIEKKLRLTCVKQSRDIGLKTSLLTLRV